MGKLQILMQRNPKARALSLISLPLAWLLIIYIGSLFALFITSIWKIDTFTSKVIREFTLQNFIDVFTDRAYFNVTIRTLVVAISVTLICALIAIPMAFFHGASCTAQISPCLNRTRPDPTLGILFGKNLRLAHHVLPRYRFP